jgi:predicted dehydrogenase
MNDAMMKQLRVGVVGAGHWAAEAHIPGFQACDGATVAAVCDTGQATAERVAKAAGIPRVYSSVETMLSAEALDLVSIVTPDDAHAEQAMAALAAGLHVLCEKPLARTAAQARAVAGAARASPVHTKVGFTMRYAPAVRRLQELVAEGGIGTPYLFQCFIQNGQFLDPAKPRHWKMMREHAGGGAIVEYGIHALDLARWLMGEVDRVCAAGRTLIPERPLPGGAGTARIDVDDSCGWLMEFANGALGVCHAGWATVGRAPGLEIRVYGSGGAAQVVLSDDLPGSEALRVASATEQRFEAVAIPDRLATPLPVASLWYRRFHHNLIHTFVDEIRHGRVAAPTFEDGAQAQALLDAVVTAMAERRWVSLLHGDSDGT